MTLIDLLNHIPAPIPVGVGFVHRIKDEDELHSETRACRTCGETKTPDAFYPSDKKGYSPKSCRDCMNARKRASERACRARKKAQA